MVVSVTPTTSTPMMLQNDQADTNESASGSAEDYFIENENEKETSEEEYNCSDSDSDIDIFLNEKLENIDIRRDIREWAVKFNISHIALSDLLKILHHVMPKKMPL